MLSAYTVIVIVMLIVTWPCGTILNSSIIAVYLSDWKKGVKLGECDQITLSMGCNYLLMQCFITFLETFSFYRLYLPFAEKLSFAIGAGFWFSVFLSFWLTAGLSICYCLRLVNLSSAVFNQIKRRLSCIVIPLLLWSVAISFIFPVTRIFAIKIDQNGTFIYHENISNVNLGIGSSSVAFNVCLPFIITSICILLSLMSLLRHIRRMKQNPQFGSPQLKNLIGACRTMFLLMALNFFFFLIIFSLMVPPYVVGTVWDMVRSLGTVLNPSCQAVVLIFGNSKLLSAWTKTLFPQ
eukprot:XP_004918205.1 PREDICTED: taste receptor type 2 member 9-like [Xenopus tropicalis]